MTEYVTKGQAVDAAYRAIHYGFNDVHKAMMEGKDLKVNADNFYYTLLENVRAEIAVAPVADVAPVDHATTTDAGWDEIYCEWKTCNRCQGDNVSTAIYCNWCGARFDGGESND